MSSFLFTRRGAQIDAARAALEAGRADEAAARMWQAAKLSIALAEQTTGETRRAFAEEARKLMDKASAAKGGAPAPAEISGALAANVVKSEITLDDVAGMDEVKEEIRLRVIAPMSDPERAARHGVKTGGGVLMYGPPGTGKTFFARAVAGELGVPFFAVNGADIFSKYVGESERNIREIFAEVRKHPMSVLFIDELESVFRKRGDDTHETTGKVVSLILQELDGVKTAENPMLLLGATNRLEMVDEAFLRTGRFDARIYVGLPDMAARRKIIENSLKNVRLPVDPAAVEWLAEATEGKNGADVKGAVERVKQRAFIEDAAEYSLALFQSAAEGI